MRARLLVVLGIGCGQAAPPAVKPQPRTASARPSDTALQDELWKLAPAGAELGIVFSARGLASLEGAWRDVRRVIAATPAIANINDDIDAELNKGGLNELSFAALGMDPARGAAAFGWSADGEHRGLLILPVVDREKFVAVVKGTKGKDADVLRGGATCKVVHGRYTCAKPAELLDLVGNNVGNASLDHPVRIAGARGDIELVGRTSLFGHQVNGAVVVEIQRGGLTMRAGVTGAPPDIAARIKGTDVTFDPSLASGFIFANVGPVFAGLSIPKLPLLPGVTLADLVDNLEGPLTIASSYGSFDIDGRVPMKDSTPAETLATQCASIPGFTALNATVSGGVCRIPVPPLAHDFDLWVQDDQLRFGTKDAAVPVPRPPTALARELASGQWPFAAYGRGSLLGSGVDLASMFHTAADKNLLPGIRALMLLDELGLGIRVDGDTVRMLMVVGTAFANPDDVVSKLLAIQPDEVLDGTAVDAAKQIAAAAPTSPFASDLRAGIGGVLLPMFAVGIVAAVAVPAFETTKKRRHEGVQVLEQLAAQAKVYRATHGAFPAGNAGPTPAKSCCSYPHDKCDDPSDWASSPWKELALNLDKPHMYRYAYASDGKTFEARAISDLDCDGKEAEWVMQGAIDANGAVTTTMTPPPKGVY